MDAEASAVGPKSRCQFGLSRQRNLIPRMSVEPKGEFVIEPGASNHLDCWLANQMPLGQRQGSAVRASFDCFSKATAVIVWLARNPGTLEVASEMPRQRFLARPSHRQVLS